MLHTVKMSSICDVHPICDKGVINYFGVPAFFEPVLSTSTSVTDFLHFPDQIFYNPWENRVLRCVRVDSESKNNIVRFFFSFFIKEKVRVKREQFNVLCLGEGVVSQATRQQIHNAGIRTIK